jgi:hypothetical protein
VKSIKFDPTIKCSQKLPNKIVQEIGLEINIVHYYNITTPPKGQFLKNNIQVGVQAIIYKRA